MAKKIHEEKKPVRIRSLSEFADEEAIELLADLIVPASNIFADDSIKQFFGNVRGPQDHKRKKKQQSLAELARELLKTHKSDVMEILKLLSDGEYHCTPVTIIKDVLTIMNDKELMDFFSEQGIDFTGALSGVSSDLLPEEK